MNFLETLFIGDGMNQHILRIYSETEMNDVFFFIMPMIRQLVMFIIIKMVLHLILMEVIHGAI